MNYTIRPTNLQAALRIAACGLACATALSPTAGEPRATAHAVEISRAAGAQPSPRLSATVVVDRLAELLGDRSGPIQQATLRELARLRDPALAPLFAQFASLGRPSVRPLSVVALAELEPARGGDILLIRKLRDSDRASTVAELIERDLLLPGQLEDLARWPDLDARTITLCAARLAAEGRTAASSRLRALAEGTDLGDAVFAALVLLAQRDIAAAAPGLARLASLCTPENQRALVTLLGDIEVTGLATGVELCVKVREVLPRNDVTSFAALAIMMQVAPADERLLTAVKDAWEQAANASLADRLRFANAMLVATLRQPTRLSEPVAAAIKADTDELVSAIGAVIASIIAGAQPGKSDPQRTTAAACTLVSKAYAPALVWASRAARTLPFQDAQQLRFAALASIDKVKADAQGTLPTAALITLAAEACDADAKALGASLSEAVAGGHTPRCKILLAGAIRSTNPKAAGVTGGIVVWPDLAAADLALLHRARHRPEDVTPRELEQLAGSMTLTPAFQVQAAWVYLRSTGSERAAIARLLAPPMPTTPPTTPPTTTPTTPNPAGGDGRR